MLPVSNPHQHTREWWLARRGKITASRMHIIMSGGARAWASFADKLRLEALSDEVEEPDLSHVQAITHGRRYEPVARAEAELLLDQEFTLVGFHRHPRYPFIGCSTDALALHRTPVEIKAPLLLPKHMQVYRLKEMPEEHRPQVQCQIAVYEADRALFVSYHPDAAHWRIRAVIVEVPRDEGYIKAMTERCERFHEALLAHKALAPAARPTSIPKLF